jgi:hypothetical protein
VSDDWLRGLKGSLEAGRVEFGVKEVHDDRWT